MTVLHGFELIEEREIPELNSRARFFRHLKTGAELLSLENEDENKVFGITFRTPPSNSTGLPHILEHSVLCGSRKYPLKDPFMQLARGSLNTFLNAFTYPDKTCYPVASQNLQDFYNLIDVYLDSVFFPLIPPYVLDQEGWHYELESLDSPLAYRGVVFNEMKGAYSSPDSLLYRYSQQSLFPGHTYGVDSGGDPQEIPDLNFAQFKAFHTEYYHPSNARIFFYGDDDPETRLKIVNEYLSEFEAMLVDSAIAPAPKLEQAQQIRYPYDAGASEAAEAGTDGTNRRGFVTLNWLLPEDADPETTLAYQILAYILVGTPASPLRKALIDSGLGEDLAGVGLENELRQMFFSTGLKGIEVEDVEKVERLIHETLERLVREGIDEDMVEAAVNTIEFRLRENNTGNFPRGLVVMLRSLTAWLYDRDPITPLAFEAPLSAIKKRLEAGDAVFENLVRDSILSNPHRVTVVLEPDAELRAREEAAERERLERARAEMSAADLRGIIENTQELKLRQETPDPPEALATLPTLKLSDLDREIKTIPLEVLEQADSRVLYHDLFTNGIVYLDLGFNLHALPQEYLPYVSLFGRALLEMGTQTEDYVKLSQRIGKNTGGIYPTTFTSSVQETDQSAAWMFLRGKATLTKSADLLAILSDVLQTARLDNRERFRQIVLEEKASYESQLVPAGHRVVNTRLRSLFTEAGWATEKMGGVSFLFFLRQLAERVENDWPAVLDALEGMRQRLVNRDNLLCNVTLDAAGWKAFQPELADFLGSLPAGEGQLVQWTPDKNPGPEGLSIPARVNYVGKGANLYALGYRMDGSIAVINNYLRSSWLYERIRLQGGAYGAFCVFDHRSGVYTFLSYRDPNLLQTIETYDQTGQFLRQLDEERFNQDELTKSIIGAIGEMDAYQLPDAKGYTSMQRYLAGDTDESRQRRRDEILSTTLEDFQELGEMLGEVQEAGQVVVLGSQEAIEAANSAFQGRMDVKKVL